MLRCIEPWETMARGYRTGGGTLSLNADHDEMSVADEVKRVYDQSGYRAAVIRYIELQKQLSGRRYVDPTSIARE